MNQVHFFIFLGGTVLIAWLSWQVSIKEKRFHGCARFVAFECILALLLMNYRFWFIQPLSIPQVFSWLTLTGSAVFAMVAFFILPRAGKSGKNFENTTQLVTTGMYGYIRHPMYLSLILLGTGIMLKKPDLFQVILGAINLLALYITARIEEKEMIIKFGQPYRDYMIKTKMFVPHLF